MYLATPDPAPPLHALCCNISYIWLAVREVQLGDSGDGNLACNATESQEDPAPIAEAWTEQMWTSFLPPAPNSDGVPYLCSSTPYDDNHTSSSTISHLLVISTHFPSPLS